MRRLSFAAAAIAAAATCLGTASAARAATPDPVVFVHGFSGSGANWTTAHSVFQEAGYSADRLFDYEYNSYGDNIKNAEGLASYVAEVKAKTGARKVDIVNHSMGGLVSLWYLKNLGGTADVGKLASLAGANHGTYAAYNCFWLTTCQQMMPGSKYIKNITTGDETPGDTSYATWYSSCDGVINPYKSTVLAGADNHLTGCVKHLKFLTDTDVLKQVAGFLKS
ncbi:esterase/lipase family protein [Actinomadura macrotermitis]|uniref:Lipase EstA n=1 Tax=Actinomadura macrotermitis TaxID=2585200 RepID=A0A7K0BVT2_9ACTN|nr:alpha/beta fold hydrolase [Actinomadura macrotermitis]MQY04794.1 Lipase EstA [Actinomadura macrotermitis]